MTQQAYHIVQWDTLYETSNSRKLATLTYYQKQNKLVGEGVGATLQHEKNVELLGTWALIEALASTSAKGHRGWLIRNGTPLTAARMAALTRVDAAHFQLALDHFCKPEIGWLEKLSLSGESPTNIPPTSHLGKLSGESPTNIPPTSHLGKLSGESPTNIPQERERERENKEREKRERGAHPSAAQPSVSVVQDWATELGIHPDFPAFALAKFREASARDDFAKPAWQKNWREKFLGFWETDGPAWLKKNKKNAARGGDRPDGWKDGDAEIWWTDSLADVRAQLGAALQGADGKIAERMREIVATREAQR